MGCHLRLQIHPKGLEFTNLLNKRETEKLNIKEKRVDIHRAVNPVVLQQCLSPSCSKPRSWPHELPDPEPRAVSLPCW